MRWEGVSSLAEQTIFLLLFLGHDLGNYSFYDYLHIPYIPRELHGLDRIQNSFPINR
jgi:hypothetical protein